MSDGGDGGEVVEGIFAKVGKAIAGYSPDIEPLLRGKGKGKEEEVGRGEGEGKEKGKDKEKEASCKEVGCLPVWLRSICWINGCQFHETWTVTYRSSSRAVVVLKVLRVRVRCRRLLVSVLPKCGQSGSLVCSCASAWLPSKADPSKTRVRYVLREQYLKESPTTDL